jgi:hypothetical protein
MRPPSLKTLILGNPVSVLLSVGVAAYLCWLCYLNATNGTVFMALVSLWLSTRSLAAFDLCRRYRAWRRDCMAVAGIATTKSTIPLWLRRTIGVGVFSGMYVWLSQQSDQVYQWAALGPGLAASILALQPVIWLLKRLPRALRRKSAEYSGPVLVVVPGPIQMVPPLGDTYRLVPDYCRQVMQARG